ncbi:M1 family metallopeptidase [Pontibacter silvestris]|uniref:M1 family metallopeptidase n=1 Tax=Pontibacter silvestris TaxID=2305183 RepID=A0ABW4WXH1_9BACT|nr:M1 family metallopeptidase [Pontibacter silvestris]MCC9137425.1 M1 family metallopeptidase [Pontibacter silvestris]
MTITKRLLSLVLLAVGFNSFAQQQLPVPRNIQPAYEKGTRSADGRPGQNYWQNTADYIIKINFDPNTRKLAGTVDITYFNNSPDTLKQVWFKLYPNLYKRGVERSSNIAPEDVSEGVQIQKLSMNQQAVDVSKLQIMGTNMPVTIKPLPPKQKMTFSVSYNYTLNEGSHNRTGQVDEGAHFVAYFFPRITVYDDIDGWNKYAYSGSEEFYNDFSNFDTEIRVPEGFIVWATGNLTNASDVLQKKYVKRLQEAEKKDGIVSIVDSTDLKQNKITASGSSNTWKFEAKDIVDFAFATSNHYLWQSTSLVVDPKTKRRTRIDVAFNPKHKDFEEVIHFGCKTVEAMSYSFPKWPFPYPHISVFDGLDQMEYPMMVNDNPLEDRAETIELTDHEIFHTMFPFYMGINETKYGWMDEGWATIGEWTVSPIIDPAITDDYGVAPYGSLAGTEIDLPITTLTTQLRGTSMFLNSYPKPALGYLYVKDMLGDELFTKALHFYIEQWHGKHPIPYDFFNAMNTGAGRNMNWFWQRWFFNEGNPDLAISDVKEQENGYVVTVTSVGSKPVPVDLTITYTDSSTSTLHRDVSVWEKGNKTIMLNLKADKVISKVELGGTFVPDSNKSNNTYQLK